MNTFSHLDNSSQSLATAWASHYCKVKTEPAMNDCLVCHIQIHYNPQAPFSLTLTDKVASSSVECVSVRSTALFSSTMCQKQLVSRPDRTEQRSEGYCDVRWVRECQMCEKKTNAGKERALTVRDFFPWSVGLSDSQLFSHRGPMCVEASSGLAHDENTNETHWKWNTFLRIKEGFLEFSTFTVFDCLCADVIHSGADLLF